MAWRHYMRPVRLVSAVAQRETACPRCVGRAGVAAPSPVILGTVSAPPIMVSPTSKSTAGPTARARRRAAVAALVLASATLSGCGDGCSGRSRRTRPLDGALAGLPAETRIVLGVDVVRARRSPLWMELSSLAAAAPGDEQQVQEFAKRTGFNPFTDLDGIVLAFPEEARQSGQMALILRGRNLDEAKLVAYARDQVAKSGDDLSSVRHAGRTLWAARKKPDRPSTTNTAGTAGFFAGDRTFVLGAGGWAEKLAELFDAPPPAGAETNAELVRLVERAGPARTLWAAALVPAVTRAELSRDPAFASAAGINRLGLGVELDNGVDARLVADLATRAQAEDLAKSVESAIKAAKRSPEMLMLGLGPYLDGISARANGVTCEMTLKLAREQVVDLFARLRAYLDLVRKGIAPGFPKP